MPIHQSRPHKTRHTGPPLRRTEATRGGESGGTLEVRPTTCLLRLHNIKRRGTHAARVSGGSPPVIKGDQKRRERRRQLATSNRRVKDRKRKNKRGSPREREPTVGKRGIFIHLYSVTTIESIPRLDMQDIGFHLRMARTWVKHRVSPHFFHCGYNVIDIIYDTDLAEATQEIPSAHCRTMTREHAELFGVRVLTRDI